MSVLRPTPQRLRQILELEQANGYSDRTVIGGIDRLIPELGAIGNSLAALPEYSSLNLEQRREWVRTALERLDKDLVQPAPPAPPPAKRTPPREDIDRRLDASIISIKGVKAGLSAKFAKLGVNTVRDLLYFFPHRHIDYTRKRLISELEEGPDQTAVVTVWQASEKISSRRMRAAEAIVGDESGNMRAIWFNQPYLAKKLQPGMTVVLSGRVSFFRGRKVFESPEWEILESPDLVHTGRLVPVYPLTAGLPARTVRRLVKATLDQWLPELPDFLPEDIRGRTRLLPLPEALRQAHYPDNQLSKAEARKRLAFDELLLIQLGVLARKREWQETTSNALNVDISRIKAFLDSLPFEMTRAQKKAFQDIRADLTRTRPMARLLQGDVGSGKTIVAAAGMLLAVSNGYQAAMMAPTEILAEQHFDSISGLLSRTSGEPGNGKPLSKFSSGLPHPISMALLTGSLKEKTKQEIQECVASGEIDILVGTHALIQKGVEFKKLGFSVVDEQHRFGVMQRQMLRQKGARPHVLVMSATPIPRTLALTLYGDLDISIIDEMPPGRKEIKTRWLRPEQRQTAYDFVRKQVASGRQAFIICPLIEESEALDAKAAVTEFERLSKHVFPELRLGLLHGRLSSSEKDEAMQAFRRGDMNVLVSTPVVEVGVDIPNATVMLIEGADRFGLAQLHQFRGRVGRGEHQSYCLLLSESPSLEARQRLSLMQETQNGFVLAERDLEFRGPGEYFGTRQSGLPDLRMARLSDRALLDLVRVEAVNLMKKDPHLGLPEHQALAKNVARIWKSGGEFN